MSVYEIIIRLKNTSSINEKIEILKNNIDNELFKKILKYTYDDTYVYFIKKYKISKPKINSEISLIEIFEILDKLRKREYTGNDAIRLVEHTFENLSEEYQEIFDKILQKDLKCGINKKLIQKVFPGLIFHIGYMGAVPYDPKKLNKILKSWVVFSQEKMDGEYSNLMINLNDDTIVFYSRKNKIQNIPASIKDKLLKELKEALDYIPISDLLILNGELIIKGYDRYTSNGLLSRIFKYEEYLKNGDTKKAAKARKIIEELGDNSYDLIVDNIKYFIWDYQNVTGDEYWARLNLIRSRYGDLINFISLFEPVETKVFINWDEFDKKFKDEPLKEIVYKDLEHLDKDNAPVTITDIEEAKNEMFKHFQSILSRGGEGTIIKDGTKEWKDGKPVYQIKMKLDFECELRIKDFKPGKPGTKYENTLGAFICESEDGLVKADPGGIDEYTRDEIWKNKDQYLNKIITVKCCGLSKAKDKEYYSLLHPAFVKIREDKDRADSFEEIKKIQDSILN